MTRIFITRHGRSMTNEDRDLRSRFSIGVKNNVLTLEGVQQALDYGAWLKEQNVDPDNIVCSPYARTKQTAFLIATALDTLVPIHYDRAIREIDWKIAGKFHRLMEKDPKFNAKTMDPDHKPAIDHRRRAFTLESPREVYERVIARFKTLVERHAPIGDLVIVSHYFPVRSIQAFVEHGTYARMIDYDPRNLCRVVYEADEVLERIRSE